MGCDVSNFKLLIEAISSPQCLRSSHTWLPVRPCGTLRQLLIFGRDHYILKIGKDSENDGYLYASGRRVGEQPNTAGAEYQNRQ